MINTINAEYRKEMSITPDPSEAEALNRILRGEISAVEAYNQILEKINTEPEKTRLMEFKKFHEEQVQHWKQQVKSRGVEPDTDSGPWGYVVKTFVGAAKILGENPTLAVLEQGEDYGLSEYRELLENKQVSHTHKEYVKNIAIPNLELHINSMKSLKKMH